MSSTDEYLQDLAVGKRTDEISNTSFVGKDSTNLVAGSTSRNSVGERHCETVGDRNDEADRRTSEETFEKSKEDETESLVAGSRGEVVGSQGRSDRGHGGSLTALAGCPSCPMTNANAAMIRSKGLAALVRSMVTCHGSFKKQGTVFCLLLTIVFVTFIMLSSKRDVTYRLMGADPSGAKTNGKHSGNDVGGRSFSSSSSNNNNNNNKNSNNNINSPVVVHVNVSQGHSQSQSPSHKAKTTKRKQLLLVTFGRSGSSFTSKLISHDPGVFYAFEPLYVLQRLQNANHGGNATANDTASSLEILRAFLTCNFTRIDASFLDNFQLRLSGPEIKDFYACSKAVSHGLRHVQCYLDLIRSCHKRHTSFSKIIRFPMAWAADILGEMPHLKILYLIRDPRAVLRSQAVVFRNFRWPQDLEIRAAMHCNQMAQDLAFMDKLAETFPGRVRRIRYESGAYDPVGYTKDIYKFAELDFTNATLNHVLSVTRSSKSAQELANPYSLVKADTMAAANHWRPKVTYDSVKVVDRACAKVYPRYQYKEVKSKKHLHSNELLFEPPKFD